MQVALKAVADSDGRVYRAEIIWPPELAALGCSLYVSGVLLEMSHEVVMGRTIAALLIKVAELTEVSFAN